MTGEMFVDTGAWFAIEVANDRWHVRAAELLRQAVAKGTPLVTSNHVLGESYTLLSRTTGHAAAFRFLDGLEKSPRVERVFVDDEAEREAYDLLRRYRDQPFSFVDGTSFAVMRRRRIRTAFAFDRHFAAAGFVRAPLDGPLP